MAESVGRDEERLSLKRFVCLRIAGRTCRSWSTTISLISPRTLGVGAGPDLSVTPCDRLTLSVSVATPKRTGSGALRKTPAIDDASAVLALIGR